MGIGFENSFFFHYIWRNIHLQLGGGGGLRGGAGDRNLPSPLAGWAEGREGVKGVGFGTMN